MLPVDIAEAGEPADFVAEPVVFAAADAAATDDTGTDDKFGG